MADTFTTNLNLTKPEVGADRNTWGGLLNGNFDAIDAAFGPAGIPPVQPHGRLTLQSGVPVLGAPIAASNNVFYTPYIGNRVPIWNGQKFDPLPFTELSCFLPDTTKSPAAAQANSIYDMFAWRDFSVPLTPVLRLTRGVKWSGSNSRASGIGYVNGVLVNGSDIPAGPAAGYGTYLGSILTNASAVMAWQLGTSQPFLSVFNAYNQRPFRPNALAGTGNTAITSSTPVRFGPSQTFITILDGLGQAALTLDAWAHFQTVAVSPQAVNLRFGIDLNGTTTFNFAVQTSLVTNITTVEERDLRTSYATSGALGKNIYNLINSASGLPTGASATSIVSLINQGFIASLAM